MSRDLRADALAIFHAGLAAVEPAKLVRDAMAKLPAEVWDAIRRAPRIHVAGGGKACAAMAAGLEQALGDDLARVAGAVNVPAGCRADVSRITLNEARAAGSNLPTPEGVAFTRAMLAQFAAAGPDDVAICLISGGGSALLTCPAEGVSLADKIELTRRLHAAGSDIKMVNVVRKELSAVKGGRLAKAFRGKLLVSLILSDVIGDDLETVASGPTTVNTSGADIALGIIRYFKLDHGFKSVTNHLETHSVIEWTSHQFDAEVRNVVVGNNLTAISAAADEAAGLGYNVLNLGSRLSGDTVTLADIIAELALSIHFDGLPIRRPACIVLGGETTVELPETPGKGGRNTHFAMACARRATAMIEFGTACVLSGGTDGEDGPTDAAGAVVDRTTQLKQWEFKTEYTHFLRRCDSYTYFDRSDDLIRIGLTGTNVADIRLVLIV